MKQQRRDGQQMTFTLRSPCECCPFQTTEKAIKRLGRERAIEIAESIKSGHTFPCHKTTMSNDDGQRVIRPQEQMCAGAMIMLMNQRNHSGANYDVLLTILQHNALRSAILLGWLSINHLEKLFESQQNMCPSWSDFVEQNSTDNDCENNNEFTIDGVTWVCEFCGRGPAVCTCNVCPSCNVPATHCSCEEINS